MGQSLLLVLLKMMVMVVIVDMSEFIETSMILGQKLVRTSMEKPQVIVRVYPFHYLAMVPFLPLEHLVMMAMDQIVDRFAFIKISMIPGHKLAQILMEKPQMINQVAPSIFPVMVLSLLLVLKEIVETNSRADMSEFIKTSMILGHKLAWILMDQDLMTGQVHLLVSQIMAQSLQLEHLVMMAMDQIVDRFEFIDSPAI